MTRFTNHPLILFLLFGFFIATYGYKANRQSTALAPVGSTSVGTLRKILIPAIQSLIGAPLRLFRQLIAEIGNFLRSHNFRELYDIKFLQSMFSRLPNRLFTYWDTLMSMEQQCIHRTLCDLADYTSGQIPKWAEQIALVYLNAFSHSNQYYQVIVHGLTAHKCAIMYDECDPDQFLNRIRTNVSHTIVTTVNPMTDAFNHLINVTSSTIDSLAVDDGKSLVSGIEEEDDEHELDSRTNEIEQPMSNHFVQPMHFLPPQPQPMMINHHHRNFNQPMPIMRHN